MDTLFSNYKKALLPIINDVLAERKILYTRVNPWGDDAIDKLSVFVKHGKLLRSGLVILSAEMFGGKSNSQILHTATALEIMHSAMLIHDDIMDKDDTRRHRTSIHKQYEQQVASVHTTNAGHVGKSLGICLGDLGFFIAWEILSTLDHVNRQSITEKIAQEMSLVGIAQMQDLAPFDTTPLDEKKILQMYQYKTGRYTIALPLITGALLAEYSGDLNELEAFGTYLGVLYQLTDDRLNIFGAAEETGRTIGSDIREGKNTLYRALLYKHASVEEKQKLSHIFGNEDITPADLAYVKLLIDKYTIPERIDSTSLSYQNSAEKIINKLPVENTYKKILTELLLFMQKRTQ